MAGGVLVLAVGLVTSLIAWRWSGRWWLAITPSGLAAVVGLFTLAGVSEGQELACGTALEACRSLLPGV
jgi:hypothetical protein